MKLLNTILVLLILFAYDIVTAQVNDDCFRVRRILADACTNTGWQGCGEMIWLETGNQPKNITDLSFDWMPSTTPWLGVCRNDEVADSLNKTIKTCTGLLLPAPVDNVIPAHSYVVFITSVNFCYGFDFAGWADTAYVVFQCAGNEVEGHFHNQQNGFASTNTGVSWGTCTQNVSYLRFFLDDNPGASVNFDNNGTGTFFNDGCTISDTTTPLSPAWNTTTLCSSSPAIDLNTLLTPTSTRGGKWYGNGVINNQSFDPQGLNGTISIKYVVRKGRCVDSLTQNITITTSSISLWNPSSATVCENATPWQLNTLLDATATAGGTWSGSGVNGTTWNPVTLSDSIAIRYIAGVGNCKDTTTHTIFVQPLPRSTWVSNSTICSNNLPLNLTSLLAATTVTNGVWSGNGVVGTNFTTAAAGNYMVAYTVLVNGCSSSTSDTISITNTAPLPITNTWQAQNNNLCPNIVLDLKAYITINNPSYTLQGVWIGNGVDANGILTAPATTGNVAITYTDTYNGCEGNTVFNLILDRQNTIPTLVANNLTFCNPADVAISIITGENEEIKIFNMQGINLQSYNAVSTSTITYTPTDITNDGVYNYKIVGRNPFCASDTLISSLTVQQQNTSFSYTPSTNVEIPVQILFTNTSTTSDNCQWILNNQAPVSSVDWDYLMTQEGTYTITLVCTNSIGCVDSSTQKIIVLPQDALLFIPNSFTPNADGINDFWEIKSTNVAEASIFIYDRWGELIKTVATIQDKWDGKYKNQLVANGVYNYVLKGKSTKGKSIVEKGSITILN